MKLKVLAVSAVLALTSIFSPQAESSVSVKSNQQIVNHASSNNSGYYYQREYIDGQWWVLVYNEDGKMIDMYPEE